MRKTTTLVRVVVGGLASLALVAGCANKGATPGPRTTSGARAPRPSDTAQPALPADAISITSVRERALALLDRLAADPNPALRANTIEAASVAPARVSALIKRALRDENVGVRTVAAMTVGKASLAPLADDVRPLLNDPSPFASCAAIFALAKNGIDADRTPIATALLNDPSPQVRSHAAYILGELGDASALALLKDAVRRPPSHASEGEYKLFQLQVAEAMVKLGDANQHNTLRAALYPAQPGDLEGTALAVQILGQLRDRESIPNLIYLSARKDSAGRAMPAEVRLAVATALARMGLNQGGFIADEFIGNASAPLRAQAAAVYGEAGLSSALGKLDRLMQDSDGGVRVAAAGAVLKIGANGVAGGVGK